MIRRELCHEAKVGGAFNVHIFFNLWNVAVYVKLIGFFREAL